MQGQQVELVGCGVAWAPGVRVARAEGSGGGVLGVRRQASGVDLKARRVEVPPACPPLGISLSPSATPCSTRQRRYARHTLAPAAGGGALCSTMARPPRMGSRGSRRQPTPALLLSAAAAAPRSPNCTHTLWLSLTSLMDICAGR